MTWESGRPIYDRLPRESGNWHGNSVVDWLTRYWDQLLTQTKAAVDQPTDWLGTPTEIKQGYIDWVGTALCGFGPAWDPGWDDLVKKRLIQNWVGILSKRGSMSSAQSLAESVIPGSRAQRFLHPRADYAIVGSAFCGNDIPMHYVVGVPPEIPRNSREWRWLVSLVDDLYPIGSRESRVQYLQAMADLSVAGDCVGSYITPGQPTPL